MALIDDLAALTRNGKMPLGKALALAPAFARSPARQVVTKTMGITSGLEENLVSEDLLPRYRQYLLDLYGGRARDLGWKTKPGENEDARFLRPSLQGLVGNGAEDPEAIAEAKRLALAWLDDHKAVDPDMVGVVLTIAARHGDRDLFDRMRAAAGKETNESFRGNLIFCLGLFQDPEIIKTALPIALSGEFDVRESLGILFAPSERRQTRDLAYDFVKRNWDLMVAKLPTDTGAYAPYVAAGSATPNIARTPRVSLPAGQPSFTAGPVSSPRSLRASTCASPIRMPRRRALQSSSNRIHPPQAPAADSEERRHSACGERRPKRSASSAITVRPKSIDCWPEAF